MCYNRVPLIFLAHEPKVKDHLVIFFILVGAMFATFLFSYFYGASLHFKAMRVKYRLNRFDDYEKSIREKWGEDAIDEFQANKDKSPY